MKKEYLELKIKILLVTEANVLLASSIEEDNDGYTDDFIN